MGSRWLGIALLGSTLWLAMGAPGAQAQVAAPSIVPGTFSSDNPAVIKWGAPSRVGFGVLAAKTVVEPGNAKADYSGGSAGFRAVGETLAFGLDAVHIADQESAFKDVNDTVRANLALQTGNSLAWGLGYNSEKSSTDIGEGEVTEAVFGLSARLAEVWFIGATIGRENNQVKVTTPISFNASIDRDTMLYGLGFRRGGSVLVHLEAFGGHKNSEKDRSVTITAQDIVGGTMEFAFGPVLIAGSSRRITYDNSTIDYANLTTADVGWAPRQGFSLVLHYESRYAKYDPSTGGDYQKLELGAVQLTWQF